MQWASLPQEAVVVRLTDIPPTALTPPAALPKTENFLLNALVAGLASTALGALVGEVAWQMREGSILNQKIRYAAAFRTLITQPLTLQQQQELLTEDGLSSVFNQLIAEANVQYNKVLLEQLAPWLKQFDVHQQKKDKALEQSLSDQINELREKRVQLREQPEHKAQLDELDAELRTLSEKFKGLGISQEYHFFEKIKSTLPQPFQEMLMFNKNNDDFLDGTTVKNWTIDCEKPYEAVVFIVSALDALLAQCRTKEHALLNALSTAEKQRKVALFGADYPFPISTVTSTAFRWLNTNFQHLPSIGIEQQNQLTQAAKRSQYLLTGIGMIGTLLGSIALSIATKKYNRQVAEDDLVRQQLAQAPLVNTLEKLNRTLKTRPTASPLIVLHASPKPEAAATIDAVLSPRLNPAMEKTTGFLGKVLLDA
jgi:transposase-like protein